MVIIPLNFARCTLFTNGNRKVRSAFNGHFSLSDFSCVQVGDQRYRRRFTRKKRPVLPVLVFIPMNFALCTHGYFSLDDFHAWDACKKQNLKD